MLINDKTHYAIWLHAAKKGMHLIDPLLSALDEIRELPETIIDIPEVEL